MDNPPSRQPFPEERPRYPHELRYKVIACVSLSNDGRKIRVNSCYLVPLLTVIFAVTVISMLPLWLEQLYRRTTVPY